MQEEKVTVTGYEASDITVLEGLEAVRKRPGMYIGTTSVRGLHHLVYEVLDNSVDEALAGVCKNIKIDLLPGNVVEITDDGRGIPTAIHPQQGKSALEIVMTILHAGGKFENKGYKISGGLHGVGVSVVNALSTWLEVEVKRDGKLWFQRYNVGVPEENVKLLGDAEGTGTKIKFLANKDIFETLDYEYETLCERTKEMAYLNKSLKITVSDYRGETSITNEFCFDGGIVDFVKDICKDSDPIMPDIIYVEGTMNEVNVEVALTYGAGQKEVIYSFVNNIGTSEGGTHVSGFKAAITRIFNDVAKEHGIFKGEDGFLGNDVREGIISVISVKMMDPQFDGQTKTKLGSSKVASVVSGVITERMKNYLDDHPDVVKALLEKMLISKRAREAAKKARELILGKGSSDISTLPGKLADCSSKKPEECEIFIVEGESAGGTAKQGRDRRTQAVLPLRGKIINVEKSGLDKALENNEIRLMVKAFGVSFGEELNIAKLRYHKIIIMADADVDGSHIRTLILTFFYRYMKELILNGNIYKAQPPLYSLKQGKNLTYIYTDEELVQKTQELNASGKGYEMQRYKGLGEMNAEQLWETTMNPVDRYLVKINIDDALEADRLFEILMGDKVEPRREFIEKNAKNVKNLDI